MRSHAVLALLFSVLIAAATIGCGGGSSGEAASSSSLSSSASLSSSLSTSSTGSVSSEMSASSISDAVSSSSSSVFDANLSAVGYVYVPAPVGAAPRAEGGFIILDDPANAPQGYAPAEGMNVRAIDVFGRIVGETVTDSGGLFALSDLPPGFVTVEIRTEAATELPEASSDATVIPDQVIRLGKAYPISREDAINTALSYVPEDADLFGAMQPFDTGTVVEPWYIDENATEEPYIFEADAYLFFIDYRPLAGYAHETAFLIVNAATGSVDFIDTQSWPPSVNGAALWTSDFDYIRYRGIDLETFSYDLDDLPENFSAEPTPEYVQEALLDEPENFELPDEGPKARSNVNSNNDLFLINILGDARTDFRADFVKLNNYFRSKGVPGQNIGNVSIPDNDAGQTPTSLYDSVHKQIKDAIETRLMNNEHSNLFVNITSHGPETYRGSGVGKGTFATYHRNKTARKEWTAAELKLDQIKACRIDVLLQTCFAESFAENLYNIFKPMDVNKRPLLVIYSAAGKTEPAVGNELARAKRFKDRGMAGTINAIPGGYFTTLLLHFSNISNGVFLPPPFDQSNGTFTRPEFTKQFMGSTPRIMILNGQPDWCENASSSSGIGNSSTGIDFSSSSESSSSLSSLGDGSSSSSSEAAVEPVGIEVNPTELNIVYNPEEEPCNVHSISIGYLTMKNTSGNQKARVSVQIDDPELAHVGYEIYADPNDSATANVAMYCPVENSFTTKLRIYFTGEIDKKVAQETVTVRVTVLHSSSSSTGAGYSSDAESSISSEASSAVSSYSSAASSSEMSRSSSSSSSKSSSASSSSFLSSSSSSSVSSATSSSSSSAVSVSGSMQLGVIHKPLAGTFYPSYICFKASVSPAGSYEFVVSEDAEPERAVSGTTDNGVFRSNYGIDHYGTYTFTVKVYDAVNPVIVIATIKKTIIVTDQEQTCPL